MEAGYMQEDQTVDGTGHGLPLSSANLPLE